MVRAVSALSIVFIIMGAAANWRSPLDKYRGVWGGGSVSLGTAEAVTVTIPATGSSLWGTMVWNTDDWGS